MKKITLLLVGVLVFAMSFFSCKEDDNLISEPQTTLQEELATETDGQVVLGKKLENPYSIKNMRKAYTSLMKKKAKKQYLAKTFSNETAIEVTDYYVRFLVENDEQKNLLVADSLNLSVIPLDVEIEEEGDYYVDENTQEQEAQWFYTSVPKDYEFKSEITYEILEELFLFEEPDEDTEAVTIAGKTNIDTNFLLDLEDEALKITNNVNDTKKLADFSERRRRAKPCGWIRVINTSTGIAEGVEGVRVVTRRWFKWGKAYTTSNGYYKISKKYRRNVNYKVQFENQKGFKIWQSIINISHATYRMGKHSKYGHSFTFNTNSVGWSWSTVNNATVQYLKYCEKFSIGKPHNNLRIVASRGIGASAAPMLRRTLNHIGLAKMGRLLTTLKFGVKGYLFWVVARFVVPDIIIRANSSYGTQSIYSTTFHELAHASHYKKVGNKYWGNYIDKIIVGYLDDSNNPYGNGTGKYHELVALGEA